MKKKICKYVTGTVAEDVYDSSLRNSNFIAVLQAVHRFQSLKILHRHYEKDNIGLTQEPRPFVLKWHISNRICHTS